MVPSISEVSAELNRLAASYEIGDLPLIRSQLTGRRRLGSTIFTNNSIKDTYAFHIGGRTELQFNVGYERVNGRMQFRHGVAFSLETNRNLPKIDILFPQIDRYNEFFRLLPFEYGDFDTWFWQKGIRSVDLEPGPISDSLRKNRTFIFLGLHYDPSDLSYLRILADFDRLLPLYRFVVGRAPVPSVTPPSPGLVFVPRRPPQLISTSGKRVTGDYNIILRHNQLHWQLQNELEHEYGQESVSTECPTGLGTRVDTVLRHKGRLTYFEIKVGTSARSCIRQGLAQVLEYSYWPGATPPDQLVIVGEPPLDSEAQEYLSLMRDRFSIPLQYRQVVVANPS